MESLGWANVYGNTYSRVREGVELPAGPPSGRGSCVAVGTSAYGVLCDHHYVNCDSMERYIEQVTSGVFPLMGARIADTPRARAQHALIDLCFHFRMSRADFLTRVGKDVTELVGRRLERLQRRGLVEVDASEVRLTTLGKLWSGRVCLALLGPSHLVRLLQMKVGSEVFGRLPARAQGWLLRRSGRM
jgi:hypothetical protein